MITEVFFGPGILLSLVGGRYYIYRDRKLVARGDLLTGVGHVLLAVGSVMDHYHPVVTSIFVVVAVWCLYDWWNKGGGGDGMKRRFKAWQQSFTGRAAPQGA